MTGDLIFPSFPFLRISYTPSKQHPLVISYGCQSFVFHMQSYSIPAFSPFLCFPIILSKGALNHTTISISTPQSHPFCQALLRMFTGLLVLDGACVGDNILQMNKLHSALLIPIINKINILTQCGSSEASKQ
jgi:hypothetical protein